jgi:hypothetical protein
MVRRCDAIHELLLSEGDKLKWNVLYEYDPDGDVFRKKFTKSSVLLAIQYMHNWSDEEIAYQLELRTMFLARLRQMGLTDSEHLMRMIIELRKSSII